MPDASADEAVGGDALNDARDLGQPRIGRRLGRERRVDDVAEHLLQRRLLRVAAMEVGDAAEPLRLQHRREHDVGRRGRGSQRIEDEPRLAAEHLAVGLVAGGPRQQQPQQGLGQVERLGPDRREQRREGALLQRRIDEARRAAVAAHAVAVVEAADRLRRRVDLVAVPEVDRRQHLLQLGERPAGGDVALAELRQGRLPHA